MDQLDPTKRMRHALRMHEASGTFFAEDGGEVRLTVDGIHVEVSQTTCRMIREEILAKASEARAAAWEEVIAAAKELVHG
jgi:hypothetical protein